jgi:hypothetical protein
MKCRDTDKNTVTRTANAAFNFRSLRRPHWRLKLPCLRNMHGTRMAGSKRIKSKSFTPILGRYNLSDTRKAGSASRRTSRELTRPRISFHRAPLLSDALSRTAPQASSCSSKMRGHQARATGDKGRGQSLSACYRNRKARGRIRDTSPDASPLPSGLPRAKTSKRFGGGGGGTWDSMMPASTEF